MSLNNYSADKRITDLLALNNYKLGKELKHWRIEVSNNYFSDDNNLHTKIFDYLRYADSRFNEEDQESFFHITLVTPSVPRTSIPKWKADIIRVLTAQGAVFYDLLSTAMTHVSRLTLFFSLNGTFLSVSSNTSNYDDMYFHNLACMLQAHASDRDFVNRITKAIQSREDLKFSAEEEQYFLDLAHQRINRDVLSLMEVVTKPVRPTGEIEEIKQKIKELERNLIIYRRDLKQLTREDYAMSVEEQDFTSKIEDFVSYLKSTNYVIDVELYDDGSPSSEYTLTIMSYLQIPEVDKDFFKESAVKNRSHPLYKATKTERILKDVMNQNVRLPITASYRIRLSNYEVVRITGVNNFFTDNRKIGTSKYISNKHIDRYNCFDGYKAMLMNALTTMDPIGFFEIARQCTATINVFDEAVMNLMVPQIESYYGDIEVRRNGVWETITMEGYLNETTQTE